MDARAGARLSEASAVRRLAGEGWFTIFPLTDWAYYLLAGLILGASLLLAFLLAGEWLDGVKRAAVPFLLAVIAVLQFPRPQVRSQHCADPAVGAARSGPSCARSTRGSMGWAALAGLAAAASHARPNTGRYSCWPRCSWPHWPTAGVAPTSDRRPRGSALRCSSWRSSRTWSGWCGKDFEPLIYIALSARLHALSRGRRRTGCAAPREFAGGTLCMPVLHCCSGSVWRGRRWLRFGTAGGRGTTTAARLRFFLGADAASHSGRRAETSRSCCRCGTFLRSISCR